MSDLNGVIQAVMDRVYNACEHDLERWQKILEIRTNNGDDTANPNCYSCEYEEIRQKIRNHR